MSVKDTFVHERDSAVDSVRREADRLKALRARERRDGLSGAVTGGSVGGLETGLMGAKLPEPKRRKTEEVEDDGDGDVDAGDADDAGAFSVFMPGNRSPKMRKMRGVKADVGGYPGEPSTDWRKDLDGVSKEMMKSYADKMDGYVARDDGPSWASDPEIWARAERAVDPTGKGASYDQPWAVVAYVYEKMGGGVKGDRKDADREDAWSDKARAAALEARKASAKANKSGTKEDHQKAALAHAKASFDKQLELGTYGASSEREHDKGLREVAKHAALSDAHQASANAAQASKTAREKSSDAKSAETHAKLVNTVSAHENAGGQKAQAAHAHEQAASAHHTAAEAHHEAGNHAHAGKHEGHAEAHEHAAHGEHGHGPNIGGFIKETSGLVGGEKLEKVAEGALPEGEGHGE